MEQPNRKYKIGDFVLVWDDKPATVVGYREKLYVIENHIDGCVYTCTEQSLKRVFVEYRKLWSDLCQ
jgi:hypothetical protein